jgi:hypothetical protein
MSTTTRMLASRRSVDDVHCQRIAVTIEDDRTVADADETLAELAGDVHLMQRGDRRQPPVARCLLHVPHHITRGLGVK